MMQCTTLNRPQSSSPIVDWWAAFLSLKNQKRTDAMANALQINFALWGMIGCAAFKSVQLVQYLNWSSKYHFRNLSCGPTERGEPAEHRDGGCGQITGYQNALFPCAAAGGSCFSGPDFGADVHDATPSMRRAIFCLRLMGAIRVQRVSGEDHNANERENTCCCLHHCSTSRWPIAAR